MSVHRSVSVVGVSRSSVPFFGVPAVRRRGPVFPRGMAFAPEVADGSVGDAKRGEREQCQVEIPESHDAAKWDSTAERDSLSLRKVQPGIFFISHHLELQRVRSLKFDVGDHHAAGVGFQGDGVAVDGEDALHFGLLDSLSEIAGTLLPILAAVFHAPLSGIMPLSDAVSRIGTPVSASQSG